MYNRIERSNMTETERYFYKKARMVASKYYRIYKYIYDLGMLSYEDLQQEACLTVLEVFNNPENKGKLKKELNKMRFTTAIISIDPHSGFSFPVGD